MIGLMDINTLEALKRVDKPQLIRERNQNSFIRFKSIVAVNLLLIDPENRALLLKRCNTGYDDGKYSMVAGHPGGNEALLDAVIREASEEVDIKLVENNIQFKMVIHRKSETQADPSRVDFFFEARQWNGTIQNKKPGLCSGLNWYTIHDLPKNLTPYIKFALERWNSNPKCFEYV